MRINIACMQKRLDRYGQAFFIQTVFVHRGQQSAGHVDLQDGKIPPAIVYRISDPQQR